MNFSIIEIKTHKFKNEKKALEAAQQQQDNIHVIASTSNRSCNAMKIYIHITHK